MKALISALLLGIAALAPLAQAAPTAPDVVIKTAVTKVQGLINKNHAQYRTDMGAFYRMVDGEVVPYFDVRYIAQLVLGKAWKTADEAQRARFAESFKNMLIRSYANAMLEYKDSVTAEWKPLRMAADATDVAVNSAIMREGKPPVPVTFMMRLGKNEPREWKVYDITVEGISLVTNFRGQISQEVKKNGLESVIARMDNGAYVAKPDEAIKEKTGS